MPRLPPCASAVPSMAPLIVRSGGRNGFARLSGREVSFASPAQVPACDQAALAQRRPGPAAGVPDGAPAAGAAAEEALPFAARARLDQAALLRAGAAAALEPVGAPAGPLPAGAQERSG